MAIALLATGCAGSSPQEQAVETCESALSNRVNRLSPAEGESVAQTTLVDAQDDGWLIRGLSADVEGGGPRNYECRVDSAEAGPPVLGYLRLCEAGERPWGCPGQG